MINKQSTHSWVGQQTGCQDDKIIDVGRQQSKTAGPSGRKRRKPERQISIRTL